MYVCRTKQSMQVRRTFGQVLADNISCTATAFKHRHGLLVGYSTEINTIHLQNRCDITTSMLNGIAISTTTPLTFVQST